MTIEFNNLSLKEAQVLSLASVRDVLLGMVEPRIKSIQEHLIRLGSDREEHLAVGALSALAALRAAIETAPSVVEAEAKAAATKGISAEGYV